MLYFNAQHRYVAGLVRGSPSRAFKLTKLPQLETV
jgi:hypothetical protein